MKDDKNDLVHNSTLSTMDQINSLITNISGLVSVLFRLLIERVTELISREQYTRISDESGFIDEIARLDARIDTIDQQLAVNDENEPLKELEYGNV